MNLSTHDGSTGSAVTSISGFPFTSSSTQAGSFMMFNNNTGTQVGAGRGDNLTTTVGVMTATIATNANLFLRTNGTGKVQTNYAMQFDQIAVTPASVAGASLVYATSIGPGTTGLKFINSSYNDELVSKNRALLFSMLF